MTLRHRLKLIERKSGRGREPTVVYFRTFFEGDNGEIDHACTKAVIIFADRQCHFVETEADETEDQFADRVRSTCIDLGGSAPRHDDTTSGHVRPGARRQR